MFNSLRQIWHRCHVQMPASVQHLLPRLAWLFAGEGVSRITRLLTAIVLSRVLTPFEFGLAAIVLASDDIIRVFSRNGIGIKIIQASEEHLDKTCQGVYRINWGISLLLAAAQLALAGPIARYFDYPALQNMLMVLALVYLIYPLAMVHVYRVQRRQDMKTTATIYGAQVGADNLLTAALALSGLGVWAVIVPKVLVAPLWVWLYRRAEKWRFDVKQPSMSLHQIWHFSRDILLVELLKSLRSNVDRLLIGAILGVEALGIYFFAINAGSGMSFALIKAYNTAIMPQLCEAMRTTTAALTAYRNALIKFAVFIVPIITLQLALAPWYVPIVFGEQWHSAIPVLMLLCGAMIFAGMVEVATSALRAYNNTALDLRLSAITTGLYLCAVLLGSQFSVLMIAALIVASQLLSVLLGYFAIQHWQHTLHDNLQAQALANANDSSAHSSLNKTSVLGAST